MSALQTVKRRGFVWPAADKECHQVVFDQLADLALSLDLCRGRDVAVQAGGNVGVWPAHLAGLFGEVHTFEPDDDNFACLLQNVPSNVRATKAGLFAASGRRGLRRERVNIGAHYLSGEGDIELLTVDSLGLQACDFICLDVEGAELPALMGAAETIERFRPVIQIEDKGLSRRFGYQMGDAEKWLASFGYEVRHRPHRDVILVAP